MLTIENLIKTFPGDRMKRERSSGAEESTGPVTGSRIRAVDDVTLEVQEGEMFTLLGPSGCGKTTTLRSIAGLERPDSGSIAVADRVLFAGGDDRKRVFVPPNRRALGMVFQSYAIWPHMKVFDNVAFPLQVMPRQKRPSKAKIRERVMTVLETMELAAMSNRQATKLSGGQQQRLALARALVTEPQLLLLDEPLSNLDAKLRESLRFELKRFQRELGITSVYVTHDQIEALALSSRIAVMRDGKIMQIGRPREIYEDPANHFVADFIGNSNFLEGTVTGAQESRYSVGTTLGDLWVEHAAPLAAGTRVVLAVRPEAIDLTRDPASGERANEVTGEVVTRSYVGGSVDHIVRVKEFEFLVRCHSSVSIAPDTAVTLRIEPVDIRVVPVD
jgi:iron(III) transport system ATP-binding protein